MIPWRLIRADWRRLWPGILVLVLLIALATALSIAVSLQERALRLGSARAADRFDLVIGAPGSETQLVLTTVFLQPAALSLLPAHVLTDLQHNPLVAWAAPVALGDFYRGMPVIGTSPALVTDNGQRRLSDGRVFDGGFEAVVGAKTGLQVGQSFSPLHGQVGEEGAHAHEGVRYTVVGVLPADGSAWDKAILVPVEAVWQVHGIHAPHDGDAHDEHEHEHEHEHQAAAHPEEAVTHDTRSEAERHGDEHEHAAGFSALVVKPKTIAGAYQLRSLYRTSATQAVFPGEVLVKLYALLGDLRQLLTYITMGTQGLVGMAVAMVAVIHLQQRQKQIGALRAFGAPRYGIFLLIWSGLMSIVGAGVLAGVGLGYLAARAVAAAMSEKSGFVLPVMLDGEDTLFILSLLAIAALVLTLPAMMAWRYSPAQALRGV
ncbi:FtsX-like permease family protein [Affinibrenneria salicis]|uniref:FtsX-like permease family protein n=1 Tax=Affinibrenneria salicis TaxID=2590031 RepID=A0A5J5FSN3_9GAMM|nr:FtsX-like permease family protein [Affinibrenneria salicis]KAA8996388.1 FtsX-like permease family protein [Affinibrenneria salicis]